MDLEVDGRSSARTVSQGHLEPRLVRPSSSSATRQTMYHLGRGESVLGAWNSLLTTELQRQYHREHVSRSWIDDFQHGRCKYLLVAPTTSLMLTFVPESTPPSRRLPSASTATCGRTSAMGHCPPQEPCVSQTRGYSTRLLRAG
jgi:hypothetical protein